MYLIAACLPTYRTLFRTVRERTRFTTRGTAQGTSDSRKIAEIELSSTPYTVRGGSKGFQELDSEELICHTDLENNNSTCVHDVEYVSEEYPEQKISEGNIRVQKGFTVETELKPASAGSGRFSGWQR